MKTGDGQAAQPTGCFKCGRPGHWSRDCHSSTASKSNPNPNNDIRHNSSISSFKQPSEAKPPKASSTKLFKSRPKLTADLFLSDDGLGYVLRHFPRAFKYHGHGHEVNDLGNLIGMYAEWHSHLIPYYSFDQFVRKVEQVCASRRVRRCIDQLKERVSNGGDPTKLHEDPAANFVDQDKESDQCENGGMIVEETAPVEDPPVLEEHGEEMINEIYQMTTDNKSSETSQATVAVESANHVAADSQEGGVKKIQITEEQRLRMEANRIKALERAAKKACSFQPPN